MMDIKQHWKVFKNFFYKLLNKDFGKFLIFVTNICTKYAWVKPLKDEKSKTVLNSFVKIVNESKRKPKKLWVDQVREFYKELMKEWLDNNYILMYSAHNEGKSVIAERFKKH